jgi:hypothetical protein
MTFLPTANQTWVSSNSSTKTSNDPFVYDKVFNEPVFISIYVFIFVPSVVCNGLVCWIVKKNPSMHTNTNFLLVNLAVADMLATVLSIFHVVDYLAIDLHLGMCSIKLCITSPWSCCIYMQSYIGNKHDVTCVKAPVNSERNVDYLVV